MSDFEYRSLAWLATEAGMSLATLTRRFRQGDRPPTVYVGRCRLVKVSDGQAWAALQRAGIPA